MKNSFPFYNLGFFNLLFIIAILVICYQIYKYGFYGYLKRKREKKDTRIKKLINYNN